MRFKNIIWVFFFLVLSSFATAQIFPTSYDVVSGTQTAGNLTCLESIGTTCIQITEVSQAPGFDVRFNYTNITTISTLNLVYYKTGSGTHTVDYEIYDYMFDLWFDVDQFILVPTSIETITGYPLPYTRFIENGLVQTRLVHEDSGNPSNSIDIYSVFIEPITGDDGDTCPVTEVQNRNSFLLLTVITLLIIFSFVSQVAIIGFFAGVGVLFYSLTIYTCNTGIFYVLFGSALLIMTYFGLTKFED